MELFLDTISNPNQILDSNQTSTMNDWKSILKDEITKIKHYSSIEINEEKPQYKSL